MTQKVTFTVIKWDGEKLLAVPYHDHYRRLEEAARLLETGAASLDK